MRGFLLLVLGLLTAGAAQLLGRAPGIAEAIYGSWLGPAIARWLSLLTGWVPFSVALATILLLLTWGTLRAVAGIRTVRTGDGSWPWVLLRGAGWTSGVVGVALAAFYLSWGLNYMRPPLADRLQLGSTPPPLESLAALAEAAVIETNAAYVALHGTPDLGVPTTGEVRVRTLSRAMRTGWARVGPALDLEHAGRAYGPVKKRGATGYLEAFDLLGIYSPFTGEANINGAAPLWAAAGVIGHEQAHQRTVTHEGEATFAGALAAIHAEDELLRYGGWMRILRATLRDLGPADRELRSRLVPRLHVGVRRDLADYNEWLRRNASPAAPVARAANDTYLRSQGVPGGRLNYTLDTWLLTAWFEANGGTLRVGADGPAGASSVK